VDWGFGWDLSPNGSIVAVPIAGGEGQAYVRLISLAGESTRDIAVPGWTRAAWTYLYWSPDGKGWYTQGVSQGGTDLLRIEMTGRFALLRHQTGLFETWAVPSPDGRHLAFVELTYGSNVWMIENF
jgi:hypothetical protein